jgi:hypothetical protein
MGWGEANIRKGFPRNDGMGIGTNLISDRNDVDRDGVKCNGGRISGSYGLT